MAETLTPAPDVRHLRPDAKGTVSEIFGRLIHATANNFPEPQFRPRTLNGESVIHFGRYGSFRGSDGGGTRDELFERLHETFDDPQELVGSARGAVAMIEGDAIRKGGFLVGIDNTLDVNSAKDVKAMEALAQGLEESVGEVMCAITSGEIAELGERTGGYGKFHLNWNMSGTVLDIPRKRFEVKNLRPGQVLVAFREKSLRANGYTAAREAMTMFYLFMGDGMKDYMLANIKDAVRIKREYGEGHMEEPGSPVSRMARDWSFAINAPALSEEGRKGLPWHLEYPDILRQLTMSPQLYSPIVYDAQGGVFGDRKVDMVAAAHITGGGVPLKGIRMVHSRGLGLTVDAVFPDPDALISMLELNRKSKEGRFPLENLNFEDRKMCDTWNRGIGLIVVVKNNEEAKKLIDISGEHGCEAEVAGEVIDKPQVQFRNHIWTYDPKEKCP